jgi:hypothetical protein
MPIAGVPQDENTVFHLKRNHYYCTWPEHAQNQEANGTIEFLQPYPAVEPDVLFEIGGVCVCGGI